MRRCHQNRKSTRIYANREPIHPRLAPLKSRGAGGSLGERSEWILVWVLGVRGDSGVDALRRKAGRPRLLRRVCYPLRSPIAVYVLCRFADLTVRVFFPFRCQLAAALTFHG